MRRLGLATFSIGLALLLPASIALGQIDHQKCYKIKDTSVKLKALADLYTPRFGPDDDCKVGKAKLLCLPANKQVTEATNRKIPFQVQRVRNNNVDETTICYQIKCPKPFPTDESFTDQFGTHEFPKLKPNLLCVGAVRSCPDPTKTHVERCRELDGDPASCNVAWFGRRENAPMSCTYNTTRNECHGCGDGGDAQPGCTNTCAFGCADTGLTAIPNLENCRTLDDSNGGNQAQCEAAFNADARDGRNESCWWDAPNLECRGCGPPNEIGDGNCSVTTGDTCDEDNDCPSGEVCVDHVSKCQNTCRAPIL